LALFLTRYRHIGKGPRQNTCKVSSRYKEIISETFTFHTWCLYVSVIHSYREKGSPICRTIFDNGTNPVHFEKTNSPTTKRTEEHEVICLLLPSIDDPQFETIISKAISKDESTPGTCAKDHAVVFSTINLL
jgi:hypothetical protein